MSTLIEMAKEKYPHEPYNQKILIEGFKAATKHQEYLIHILEWTMLNYQPVISKDKSVIQWNLDDAEALYSTEDVVKNYLEHNQESQSPVATSSLYKFTRKDIGSSHIGSMDWFNTLTEKQKSLYNIEELILKK